jgi:hypothetical protein
VNGTGADVRTHSLSPGQAKWLRQRRRELVGSRQPMGTIAFLALCIGIPVGIPFGLALVAIVHYLLYTLVGSRGELFVLSILCLATVWYLHRWKRRRTGIEVDRAVCVVCGYSLHDAVAEPDGCALCPECGAAWRLEA